jgi:hypothetical protein
MPNSRLSRQMRRAHAPAAAAAAAPPAGGNQQHLQGGKGPQASAASVHGLTRGSSRVAQGLQVLLRAV